MSFRIRFIVESSLVTEEAPIPEPLFGHVHWESEKVLLATRAKSSGSMQTSRDEDVPLTSTSATETPATTAECVDRVIVAATDEEAVLWFSGNPEIEISKGVLKLFKDNKCDPARPGGLPAKRSDLLCLLAIPAHYSSAEICRFLRSHIRHVTQMRVLRDQSPDRLLLVLRFINQDFADAFYLEYNGARFNSVEPECCKVAFLSGVEFLEPRDSELLTPVNQHEMPSCPVCLERLEEQASGIFITLCNHSFHCSCLAQWNSDSSCPVCRV
jgi:hypothetical protein